MRFWSRDEQRKQDIAVAVSFLWREVQIDEDDRVGLMVLKFGDLTAIEQQLQSNVCRGTSKLIYISEKQGMNTYYLKAGAWETPSIASLCSNSWYSSPSKTSVISHRLSADYRIWRGRSSISLPDGDLGTVSEGVGVVESISILSLDEVNLRSISLYHKRNT